MAIGITKCTIEKLCN